MAAPIGPGDFIEFVGPVQPGALSSGSRLVGEYRIGQVTICEAVIDRMALPSGEVVAGLKARDVKVFRGDREIWLAASQWRPIYRPKSSFIESLKQPLSVDRDGQRGQPAQVVTSSTG